MTTHKVMLLCCCISAADTILAQSQASVIVEDRAMTELERLIVSMNREAARGQRELVGEDLADLEGKGTRKQMRPISVKAPLICPNDVAQHECGDINTSSLVCSQ